jgi:hypothetical protein
MQVGAFQDYDEFLTTDSVQAIGHANSQVDYLSDTFQNLVADRVAMNIIDLLEMIEVE